MNALYIICGLGFLSLLAEIANAKRLLATVIIAGLLVAAALAVADWNTALHFYNDMMVFDNFAIAFTTLILMTSLCWFWMSHAYFSGQAHETDRSALILFSVAGAVIMVAFNNMAMLFLGIEMLSISLYVLAGSNKDSLWSNESSFKYFLMGSFATGFLLMGIALVYGATGSFHLTAIAAAASGTAALPGFYHAGIILILVGMAFKISAVPFHFWAPDVYEGAPVTITAFMSTVVKIAAIGAFYRLFSVCFAFDHPTWDIIIQVMTVLTLLIPNVIAVFQTSVKRMLAYSSVGNVGYILLAFMSNSTSASTIFYYLVAYSTATIAAFCVLQEVEKASPNSVSFRGLYKRNPLLAVVMTMALFSLAGIPPLAGFFGKYLVFSQALQHGHAWFVVLGVVTSLIGVFYYFRVVVDMFLHASTELPILSSNATRALLCLLAVILVISGILPNSLFGLLN